MDVLMIVIFLSLATMDGSPSVALSKKPVIEITSLNRCKEVGKTLPKAQPVGQVAIVLCARPMEQAPANAPEKPTGKGREA